MRSFLIALLIFLGCGQAWAADIAPEQAFARASAGELLIVDVRQPEEWRETGMAPGAVGVPLRHPAGEAGLVADIDAIVGGDRDRPLALVCRSGRRSAQAAEILRANGFTQVYNVSGGMLGGGGQAGWVEKRLPVEPCREC